MQADLSAWLVLLVAFFLPSSLTMMEVGLLGFVPPAAFENYTNH